MCLPTFGQTTYNSVQNGRINLATTWDIGVISCASPPLTLIINEGHNVKLLGQSFSYTCQVNIIVKSGGILSLKSEDASSSNLELGSGSTIIIESGGRLLSNVGAGSHEYNDIFINGTIVWNGETDGDLNAGVGEMYTIDEANRVVLPVDLLSFSVSQKESSAQLTWVTASELNNDYFTIERSVNGISYEEVAIIKGGGTSSLIQNYACLDSYPLEGLSYYRLIQTDFDGMITVFNQVAFNAEITSRLLIYPNPASKEIRISGVTISKGLELMNIQGQVLYSQSNFNINDDSIVLDISGLKPGLYLLRNGENVVKFIKE